MNTLAHNGHFPGSELLGLHKTMPKRGDMDSNTKNLELNETERELIEKLRARGVSQDEAALRKIIREEISSLAHPNSNIALMMKDPSSITYKEAIDTLPPFAKKIRRIAFIAPLLFILFVGTLLVLGAMSS